MIIEAVFLLYLTMVTINPDKYIRKAYFDALKAYAHVWEKKVPKDTPIPSKYYLISSQTKNETERKKCGSEWSCSIVIECVNIQSNGYANSEIINDMEQDLLSVVDSGLIIQGFDLKQTNFVDSISLDTETPTNSIYRRVVNYQHWLNNVQTT